MVFPSQVSLLQLNMCDCCLNYARADTGLIAPVRGVGVPTASPPPFAIVTLMGVPQLSRAVNIQAHTFFLQIIPRACLDPWRWWLGRHVAHALLRTAHQGGKFPEIS